MVSKLLRGPGKIAVSLFISWYIIIHQGSQGCFRSTSKLETSLKRIKTFLEALDYRERGPIMSSFTGLQRMAVNRIPQYSTLVDVSVKGI